MDCKGTMVCSCNESGLRTMSNFYSAPSSCLAKRSGFYSLWEHLCREIYPRHWLHPRHYDPGYGSPFFQTLPPRGAIVWLITNILLVKRAVLIPGKCGIIMIFAYPMNNKHVMDQGFVLHHFYTFGDLYVLFRDDLDGYRRFRSSPRSLDYHK